MRTHQCRSGCAAIAVAACLLASCRATRTVEHEFQSTWTSDAPVIIDGDISDWPSGSVAIADADYVYLRFSVANEEMSLQAGVEPVSIWLDTDGDPTTGRRSSSPRAAASLGVDLEITFSPASQEGRGVRALALKADGGERPVSHEELDLFASPTYSSEWFEVRLSRRAPGVAGLGSAGTLAGIVVLARADGSVAGWSDTFTASLPSARGGARLSDAIFEPPSSGAIRVVSWNVLRGAPAENSPPFERVLQALNPDVVLIQEWPDASAAEIAGWFTALIPSATPWEARVAEGTGCAVVARHPIRGFGPEQIPAIEGGDAQPTRWVGAVVGTPIGEIAASSVHLKCCGSKDSPEDLKRLAQARAINAALRDAAGPGMRLIGGDMNLVGSRPPLDALGEGMDADGGAMGVAGAWVLGDAAAYTWRDGASEFSAGRLDYLLLSDSTLATDREFVLDASRLSDRALARLGIDRGDRAASDHLPVVVDIRPRR